MILLTSYLDFAKKWQLGFQDPATAIMEGIIELHNSIFFYLIIITIMVFFMFYKILLYFSFQFNNIFKNKNWNKEFNKLFAFYITKKNILSQQINHNSNLEVIWVILPAIILIAIAIPSFTILYSMDEIFDPAIIIKVIGHQWYWSYEYSYSIFSKYLQNQTPASYLYFFPEWKFDSLCRNDHYEEFDITEWYVISPLEYVWLFRFVDIWNCDWHKTKSIGHAALRLLETDIPIYLPTQTHIQILVTSEDVLHSWAIPSLGIKIDCVPGRLNQVSIFIKRPGVFYGQCSEICGINHGFMPIKIIAVSKWCYLKYISYYFK